MLRGRLYPKGASANITKKLLQSIEQDLPVVLYGVLAAETALSELPKITQAANVFSDRYENTQFISLLVDWPKLQDRSLLLGIASLNQGLTLGLTTELNPNILMLYGRDILLANIDVR